MLNLDLVESVLSNYKECYGEAAKTVYFSPGRVNLIGEHIDYNNGSVLPVAIDVGNYAAIGESKDQYFRFFTDKFKQEYQLSLADLETREYKPAGEWTDYIQATLLELLEAGIKLKPFYASIGSDLPGGAGLSSSASLELLIATTALAVADAELPELELAKLGQVVENKYIGVQSGLMDQLAIALGKEGEALLYNLANHGYRHFPLNLAEARILVIDSHKRRSLRESKYNERREECQRIADLLFAEGLIDSEKRPRYEEGTGLALLDPEKIAEANILLQEYYPEEASILSRRLEHVITENSRVYEFLQAVDGADLKRAGEVLNASHASLAKNYEVTGKEMDSLATACQAEPEVYGARICGAGFGGVVIALVSENFDQSMLNRILQNYHEATGYRAEAYFVNSTNGPSRID
ncbi:MAG: galactokinase [Eubacteriales bacterium]|nr:galactokinase [Eubacteriales bacterium]